MLLNLHSYYSLRYGTLSLEKLMEGMVSNGYDTAVLTDINNSSATVDFIRRCRERKEGALNGLAGMEFRKGDRLMYIGIAKNAQGFGELNAFMTALNRQAKSPQESAPGFEQVFVVYPWDAKTVSQLRENEYIGIRPSEVNRLVMASAPYLERYVILAPVSFGVEADYTLHRQLRAIDHNLLISQLLPVQVAPADEVFLPREELLKRYGAFPQLIRNTEALLGQCSFDLDFKESKNKKSFTGSHYDDKLLLHKKAMAGFERRYGKGDKVALERVAKELGIIENLRFSSYFLITDDICEYARSQHFHYVGRGSGANSVVAYCLGITDVDPIALDLYFERFLNPKRKRPPDFDMDFCWNERDRMYDYLFGKYQEGYVALMGAMSTFRSRSIIRELGKVYGLPKGEIDRLVHEPQHMLNKNEVTHMILSVYAQMAEFPNQRSIHASGVLISELPLTRYAAMDYPPKGLPTVQFDMHVADHIGFEKFDVLSQRGIGHIRDCRQLVLQNRGEVIDTSNPKRFFKDGKIAEQLRSARSIGCFYIESPAMRQLLSKLRCDNYPTLVAASSVIRPGVSSSGMMKAYIERHLDSSTIPYLHPLFEEQLKETYGVMVYQEDVMKIGHYFGGLDMAEADVLRRMMSGKDRDGKELREIERKFFANCKEKGHPESISREVWRQMESFAGYSFNKAHSASYAVESYQSLYLKTYYPLEFMVSVLNNYGGFYQRQVYVNEAKRAGAMVCLPCLNRSVYNTSISGKEIYLGFDGLQHLEARLAHLIPEERQRNGGYKGVEDVARRTGAGLEQLVVLIRCGALRFTGMGKKELLWEAHLFFAGPKRQRQAASLFEQEAVRPKLPPLDNSPLEDLYDELELIGFPVSDSLFSLAKSDYRGNARAHELAHREGETVRMVGNLVCDKRVRTSNGEQMKFGTFVDEQGDFFDTVHFPPTLKPYPLSGNGLYLIEGSVALDFGCPAIEVSKCGRMPLKPDPRSV